MAKAKDDDITKAPRVNRAAQPVAALKAEQDRADERAEAHAKRAAKRHAGDNLPDLDPDPRSKVEPTYAKAHERALREAPTADQLMRGLASVNVHHEAPDLPAS